MVKVNPIVEWTQKDVDDYIAEHGVLVNPLVYDGYPSIGCRTCTARVEAGADPRSGRWAGTGKTACGLHVLRFRRPPRGTSPPWWPSPPGAGNPAPPSPFPGPLMWGAPPRP